MMKRCHIYGKLNVEGPKGWEEDDNAPWYDPKGKYGKEIPGGLVKGYTAEEINSYFDKIEGFANYCFNKAHAACYAYIGFLCAWLKTYYPAEFMAAVLSMAMDDKIAVYINICEKKLGIKITSPDINISGKDFTPDKDRILYGLGAVKGVGEASLPAIIENAPYKSIEDAVKRIPKKAFNKRIAENLIKSGAFDFDDPNRNEILNRLHKIRKDKSEAILSPDKYTRNTVMKYEEDTLGTHISCHTWWEDLDSNKTTTLKGAKVKKLSEQVDKKGNLMAFGTMSYDKVDFHMLVFASKYSRLRSLFDTRLFKTVTVSGKKDNKGTFIISDAVPDMTLAEYEAS